MRYLRDLDLLKIIRDLDQVMVGVANVDGPQLSGRAGAFDWAFFDVDAQSCEVLDHLFKRGRG